jgi:hypothetical protein
VYEERGKENKTNECLLPHVSPAGLEYSAISLEKLALFLLLINIFLYYVFTINAVVRKITTVYQRKIFKI